MCRFFSLTSDGRGEIRYFDWEQRKRILDSELDYNPDSHTSINDFYGYKGEMEDCRNRYEYNPITGVFTVDAIHGEDDSAEVEKKVRALDFSLIVPQLVIKPIVNPLLVKREHPEPSAEEISLLKRWASVEESVWDSVEASVVASVGGLVWKPVGDSVWKSVWDSVRGSVRASVVASVVASVEESVWKPVMDSVWDSVWDAIWAYISSFFSLDEWRLNGKRVSENPFQPAIDLWEAGLVPNFDGEVWRLHAGKGAQIVYEMEGA